MITLLATTLKDTLLEQVRRNLVDAVKELQLLPFARARVIRDVVLASGVETVISHGLGRVPIWVKESCVRGATAAGYINEIRDSGDDRAKYVRLVAASYGATITVDLVVL